MQTVRMEEIIIIIINIEKRNGEIRKQCIEKWRAADRESEKWVKKWEVHSFLEREEKQLNLISTVHLMPTPLILCNLKSQPFNCSIGYDFD